MKTCRVGLLATAMFLTAAVAWVTPVTGQATQSDEITGVVMSGNGPEEGVWVIAETDDLAHGSSRPWSPGTAGAS